MTESASKIIRNRLQALGFDVVAAGSGHHGLALIEDHASKGCQIDGILLNWKMPGSDYSMAALQKLQEEHAEIPVIVMAALSQIERLDWFEDMMRKGARDCIQKPLDTDLLWEKCSRHFMPLSQRRERAVQHCIVQPLWLHGVLQARQRPRRRHLRLPITVNSVLSWSEGSVAQLPA